MQIAPRAVNTEPGMEIYNHVFVKYEYVPWKLMMEIGNVFWFPYELLVIVGCENMTVVGLVIGNG